jgi:alanyl-tRNA synthetase
VRRHPCGADRRRRAITGTERFKGGTRITFVCGGRALASHRTLLGVVQEATRAISVPAAELRPAIERMLEENQARSRAIVRLQADLAGHRAAGLRAAAETVGGHAVVLRAEPGWDAAGLKALAQAVVAAPEGCGVAVLVGDGHPAPLVVARSSGVSVDAAGVVAAVVARLGGRGGGRAELAQGGVPAAAADILDAARGVLS